MWRLLSQQPAAFGDEGAVKLCLIRTGHGPGQEARRGERMYLTSLADES